MEIESKPTWKADVQRPEFPKLETDIVCDVAVVGGGLAGILIAYRLAQEGKKVAVLEKNHIGSGATEYTTAFITQYIDTDLQELVKLFGKDSARAVWQSGMDAINFLEEIVRKENIDCEFTRTDVTIFANDEKQFKMLEESWKTESEYGFNVSKPKSNNLNFYNRGYYRLHNQAKFHPLKFLFGVARKSQNLGVQIFEQSEVEKIQHSDEKSTLTLGNRKVEARQVVIATYQPFHNRIRLFLKRGMYKSYVLEARILKGLIEEGLYWDLDNPYHYFRIDSQNGYDRMVLGGEDVKSIFKISKEKSFKALEEYLAKILPKAKYEITREWMGPILEPSDGLALIGKTFDNEYVASAFSGNGMTYSAISAMIIPDLILGRSNVYQSVYDPKRIPTLKQLFLKGSDYIEEFFGAAAKNVFKKQSSESGT